MFSLKPSPCLPVCAELATGRDRKVAAAAIATRLRYLSTDLTAWWPSPTGKQARLVLDGLVVGFWRNDSGLYFRIDAVCGGRPLMTGYLRPERYGTLDEGRLQIMSWRRGWERSLFARVTCELRPVETHSLRAEQVFPETLN